MASLSGSLIRLGWHRRSEESGNRRGALGKVMTLIVLLFLIYLALCVRILVKQIPHASEEWEKDHLLLSVTAFVECAIFLVCFLSALRHCGKEHDAVLSACGRVGVETVGNKMSRVNPLKYDPEMKMTSKCLNTNKNQAMATSTCQRLQDSFLTQVLNFRKDQSFRQAYTVCPAFTSLASHFASGTYGQPGSSQQLQKEGVRLASFKDFPTSVHVSAIRLAQAGFFYTGERDMVRCFSCGVTHDGWQMGDRPTLVHARISPNCPLVRGSDTANLPLPLPVTNRPTFPEPGSIDSGYGSHSYSSSSGVPSVSVSSSSASYSDIQSNAASSVMSEAAENGPITSSLSTPENSMSSWDPLFGIATPMDGGDPRNLPMPTKRLDLGGAVYPLYSQMDARKRSFSNWVEDQGLPSVDELISLGFFCAGYADCVRCFFCGIGLKSWEPGDIPAEVHARWRSTCEYLRLVKGDEFVDRVANGGRNLGSGQRSPSGGQTSQPLSHVPENQGAGDIRNHGQNLRGARDGEAARQTRTEHPTARSERSESHIIQPEGALQDESNYNGHTVDAAAGTQHADDTTDLPPRPGYNDGQDGQGRRIARVTGVRHRSRDRIQDENGERGIHGGQPVLSQLSTMRQLIHRYGWVYNGRSGARQLSDVFGRNCHRCQSRPINAILFNCHDCVLCHVCVSEVDICPRCNQEISGYWVQPF